MCIMKCRKVDLVMKVRELMSDGLAFPDGDVCELPQAFLDVLPTNCVCGSELEINETLTQLYCPNPRCITKVTQRMVDMLAYIGVLGMGESKCRKFLECVRYPSPYAMFAWNMGDYDKYFKNDFGRDFMQNLYDQLSTHRTYTLAEFIKVGFFPKIQDSSFKLFKGYSTATDFYADLDSRGMVLVAELLGLTEAHQTVVTTYDTLLTYRQDILQGEKFVHIRQSVKTLNVCISKAVGPPYKSKSDFVQQINEKYATTFHANWLNSVSSSCDYLICRDTTEVTNKIARARALGIPIVTGAEFEEIVKNL